MKTTCCVLAALVALACRTPAPLAPEAFALNGAPLYAPVLQDSVQADFETKLGSAVREHLEDPSSEEAAIWHGRRLAYLGRYREAIAVFSAALLQHPESYKLLRHRGHRFISVRRFDLAIRDLELAAQRIEGVPDEIEPDGLPNAQNLPRSSSHTNIYYHLGLARYLTGDWEGAADAYRRCLAFAENDDMRCATAHWLYTALIRAGKPDEAQAVLEPIQEEMDVIENEGYHSLLLFYRGWRSESELLLGIEPGSLAHASVGYGIACAQRARGDAQAAQRTLLQILGGSNWAAFGRIAAEADLVRDPSGG